MIIWKPRGDVNDVDPFVSGPIYSLYLLTLLIVPCELSVYPPLRDELAQSPHLSDHC
jgi:hypothetical protein